MVKEQNPHDQRILSVSGGVIQIDLRDFEGRRATAVIAARERSPLASGAYFVELESERIHELSLAENPPAGEYTVVILDPDEPRRPPWVSRIQIREIRG